MKVGMSLQDLLIEVTQQNEKKRDFVAPTESMLMVERPDHPDGVALVLHTAGAQLLERFELTENCHNQIAQRLKIPLQYYKRLLNDHRDLVIHQVNALFKREPEMRLLRTLDGKARAFLSDKYRPMDNAEVLEQVLPPLLKEGGIESRLINSHVGENQMQLRVLFTDDRLAQDVGEAPHGGHGGWQRSTGVDINHNPIRAFAGDPRRDVIRPGAIITNSETGNGSMSMRGFFWRAFCDNGCIAGMAEQFAYSRHHVGGRLDAGELEFSESTRRKQNEVIVAELGDVLALLSSAEYAQKIGDSIRKAKEGPQVVDAIGAVQKLAQEVQLRENESNAVLTNLLRDGDLSRWGAVNAVTAVANDEQVSFERAHDLEQIGAKLLSMELRQWENIAYAKAA